MDSDKLFMHRKVIRKLLKIEEGGGALATLGRHLSFENQRLKRCYEEANRRLMHDLKSEDREIIRVHGRNLNIEELTTILDSKSFLTFHVFPTSILTEKYGFLTNINYEQLYTEPDSAPSEETIEAFKISGVISQTTIKEISDSLNTPDVKLKFKAAFHIALAAAETETNSAREKQCTDGSMASNAKIRKITPQSNDSQPLDNIPATSEKKGLELRVLKDIQENAENSKFARMERHDYSQKPNLFPTFLCKRTDVFFFRSIPDRNLNPIVIKNYKEICAGRARDAGREALAFCETARAAFASIKAIFEEMSAYNMFLLSSSTSAIDDEKEFVQEMFAELCVLKCDMEEGKLRFEKFLIDMDILLVHDYQFPENDDGHWTDRELYSLRLAIKKVELSILKLDNYASALKNTQAKVLLKYNTI